MGAPRILYVSSSIGLGHASKDLAIAGELRRAEPDVEIAWLAGHPASEVLADAGERVLPDAASWRGASAILEKCAGKGEPNLVRYIYRSLPAFEHNWRIVKAAAQSHSVDVVVGNEAWEIDIPLILRLLHLPAPFVLITDFVGAEVVHHNVVDDIGAWLLNALWSLDTTVYRDGRDSAIFLGELDDIPDLPLGAGLASRREHARRLYDVVGHAIRFDPEEYRDQDRVRQSLGYGKEPLVVCTVGGTSIGVKLLQLCADAYPSLAEALPGVRMVLVFGPRLTTDSVRLPPGVEARGLVPRLYEHFAAADVLVAQCGGSSTTELAALEKPFLYFPVAGHFEQQVVAARLERYGVGKRMDLAETTPTALAEGIAGEYGRVVPPCAMPVSGAPKAASHILDAVERNRVSKARRS